ncbi:MULTISPECIES: hypothetical protein [Ensifer]|uniref:Uncharacterized protein n=1 Tax=Ensifer canadensis TaxID=555315 RepID=A0AAW4FH77_9HYPH|nr:MULTISPECIES: hypothetical protein [Ensifer]MDP9628871.1 hypothetical protein [Ensifer adhaerens]KQU98474.1 hypothetical protein ASD00_02225 [Ensifer sp. Root31]KQW63233.1 hypothetical protein ASD02_03860 [Ensifer sp. Root1252]KQW85248.1 hypothetical protein ASD03_06060 [Ensifer sp. Root127]KQY75641.1 hypothetical protein ASD52_24305 [Ensifer sp. Root142]
MLGTTLLRDVFLHSVAILCLLAGLLASASTVLASPAGGADMQFLVVRSNQPGCEPTCPEWISAEGTIVRESPTHLKKLLKAIGDRRLPIVVTSLGGDVDAAMVLGRIIRARKLEVAVGKTRFVGCQPQQKDCRDNDGKGARLIGTAYSGGAYCNSACPLMLAGGARRVVGQWAYLGVHQITAVYAQVQTRYQEKYRIVNGRKKIISKKVVSQKNVGNRKTYEMSKAMERELAAYLAEMGVGRAVIDQMKITPAADMRKIEPVAMMEMKLITQLGGVELLTAAGVCKTVPASANCRVFVMSDLKR